MDGDSSDADASRPSMSELLEAHAALQRVREKSRDWKRKKRAEEKQKRGLDPALHVRANRRADESDEAYAARLLKNREKAKWHRKMVDAKKSGTWRPRKPTKRRREEARNLTPEEKRRKEADRKAAWRAAKRRREEAAPDGASARA